MTTIQVGSSSGAYNIFCARGALSQSARLVKRLGDSTGVFLLSSPRVWHHVGAILASEFMVGSSKRLILFDDRESSKRLSTVEEIARKLVRMGADRDAILLAAGGGVVGDTAGFAAATYLRGVRLVHLPTTLVAQVDSSIGGKTGVNLPEGKNLVGAFYPPSLIVADPATLQTLPHREFRSGLYEVVKYGIIADPGLFDLLEQRMSAVLRLEPAVLSRIIPRCMEIKSRVVQNDERENGLRQILNFGHTIGHALETATNYRYFLHGEAVGWGMIGAILIGLAMDRIQEAAASRMIRLISSIGPLPPLGRTRASQLRPILAGDKKARGGRIRWVLPRRIGNAEWGVEIPWGVVERAFAELPTIAAKSQL